MPFDGDYPVTQSYGYDPSYQGNTEHVHFGIDWGLPEGTEVRAATNGIVIIADGKQPSGFAGALDGAWGNYIEIDHGSALHTGYCHLKSLIAYAGQQVRSGQVIGLSGQTGIPNVTVFGPHLHFQVLRDGVRIDPMPFLA